MFDEEAPTISLVKSDVFELIRTSDVIGFDTSPVDALQFEDTAVAVIEQLHPPVTLEKQTTDKMLVMPEMSRNKLRAATDADWPPKPRPPDHRRTRHAGMYKAITSITKLTKIKGD
jgi:hypothetical protein